MHPVAGLLQHLAEDPGLIEAFTAGEDLHAFVASRVFGVEPAAVTSEMRAKIKDWLDRTLGHADREVILTSGTSGGLLLALMALARYFCPVRLPRKARGGPSLFA